MELGLCVYGLKAGQDGQKKAVFITCSPVFGVTRTVLRDVIQASSFEYCVLITAAHPSVHHFLRHGGPREGVGEMAAFHDLEEEMLQWMGNMNFTVEVFYFPIFVIQVMESVFLTPPFASLFPTVDSDLSYLKQHKSVNRAGDQVWPPELQAGARHLVSCLHSLLAQWDACEDLYSLGHFSGLLAAQLEALPAAVARRRAAGQRCSLILVDRTLDLATAASHDSEALLDRVLAVLPRLPGHGNDVAVDMSPLCAAQAKNTVQNPVIPPGCLFHPEEQCLEVFEWLVGRPQKDVLAGLHQRLAARAPAGRDDTPGSRLATRVTPSSLEKQVASFRSHPDKIAQCSGLLQQTLAVTQTLRSARLAELAGIVSTEKLLLQNLCVGGDTGAVLAQVTQLLRTRRERGLPLGDLLGVLVRAFSLAGSDAVFPRPAVAELRAALERALREDRHLLHGSISHLVNCDPKLNRDVTRSFAAQIIEKLKSAANARKDFVKYRSLLRSDGGGEPGKSASLLQQLVTDLLDPDRPELCDLACKSAGLKELLKTGFSMLLNLPRQQRPTDNPLVLVFVVGGITAQEVQMVQAAARAAGHTAQLLLGSTRLVSPADVTDMYLSSHVS
ncbi:sec1 family domain-containing protein 2-like isoform X2 [Bacillus rossius redtenbacheri]|uniref:sec1 family domain-containing protein 2-like isoform X2 n=1 Tax=Bacillus rossius redtenbacheri TaxID=93214 RepID=UPI002FDDFCDA